MSKPFVLVLITTFLFLSSCQKDKFEWPVVHTGEVVEVTTEGVVFHGKILEQGNLEIIDHGFVWANKEDPNFVNGYVESLGLLKDPVFSVKVISGLEEKKNYYLRAYVKTKDKTIYGRQVSFISLGSTGPEISNFHPVQATWGDTISIIGVNFSKKPGENIVKLNTIQCQVISNSDTLVKFLVPENLLTFESQLSLSFAGSTFFANETFSLSPPEILGFSPQIGTNNTMVTISGNYFKPNSTMVFIGEKEASIIEIERTVIKILVPQGIQPGERPIKIVLSDQEVLASDSFTYVIPIISEVVPASGTWLQEITIKGSNFSSIVSENTVSFENIPAAVVSASNDSLVARVPVGLLKKNARVRVTVSGETSVDNATFTLHSPQITGINPPNGTFGDIVEISGQWFNPEGHRNKIFFNNIELFVINATSNQIRVRVPETVTNFQNQVQVRIGDMQATLGTPFLIDLHSITGLNPGHAVLGQELVINGTGFNPFKEKNSVFIGTQSASIVEASHNQLVVAIPENTTHGSHSVSVNILGRNVQSTTQLSFYVPWIRLNDLPFGFRYNMVCFNIADRVFAGGGNLASKNHFLDFYEYLPSTDSWVQRAQLPANVGTSFSTETKGYILTHSGLYSYNPILNQWSHIGQYPVHTFAHSAFTVNNVPYVIGGMPYNGPGPINIVYRFNETNSTWTQMANYPINFTYHGIGFSVNNKGYATFGYEVPPSNKLFSFNPTTNSWQVAADLLGVVKHIENQRVVATAFTINDKGYFGTGTLIGFPYGYNYEYQHFNDFYEFNPSNSEVRFVGYFPGPRRKFASSFSTGGYGYLFGGTRTIRYESGHVTYINYKDVYKFDPSKLPPLE